MLPVYVESAHHPVGVGSQWGHMMSWRSLGHGLGSPALRFRGHSPTRRLGNLNADGAELFRATATNGGWYQRFLPT